MFEVLQIRSTSDLSINFTAGVTEVALVVVLNFAKSKQDVAAPTHMEIFLLVP